MMCAALLIADCRMLPHTPTWTTAPGRVTQVWCTACVFPKYKESCMGIFTIIGVVVVVLFIVGYLGLR